MAHDIFVQVNMHFLGLNERSSTQDVSKWLVTYCHFHLFSGRVD